MNLLLAFNLKLKTPSNDTIKEIKNLIISKKFIKHFGNYHDGGWESLGLITSGGDPNEDREIEGKKFEKTIFLKKKLRKLNSYLDSIPFKKKRVRIMRLKSGRKIFTHFDRTETYDLGNMRIHIPIITNPKVIVKILNKKYQWKKGQVYYADFSFPHSVENNGDSDRYHLVIDCEISKNQNRLFPKNYLKQKFKRNLLRFFYQNYFRITQKTKLDKYF